MLTAIRSWFRLIPRTRPFGEGVVCDGCDERLEVGRRAVLNGGFYCQRCYEEIDALGWK